MSIFCKAEAPKCAKHRLDYSLQKMRPLQWELTVRVNAIKNEISKLAKALGVTRGLFCTCALPRK